MHLGQCILVNWVGDRGCRALLQDPLNTVGNVCARTGNELLSAFRQLGSRSHEITLPVYVGHGRAMSLKRN